MRPPACERLLGAVRGTWSAGAGQWMFQKMGHYWLSIRTHRHISPMKESKGRDLYSLASFKTTLPESGDAP